MCENHPGTPIFRENLGMRTGSTRPVGPSGPPVGGRPPASGGGGLNSGSRKQRAAALGRRALLSRNPRMAMRHAATALDLDRDCVDALLYLARTIAGTHAELVELVRMAVAAGQRGLGGPEFIREHTGQFGQLPHAEPYVRARVYLAQLLVEAGSTDQGLAEYEAVLGLDVNDEIRLRDTLMACYLDLDRLGSAWALVDRFPDDNTTLFAWVRVLKRLAVDGDIPGARQALETARRANPYVEGYLSGKVRIPAEPPSECSHGDEGEAIVCADILTAPWHRGNASQLLE